MGTWIERMKGHMQEVLRTKKSAHSIALGFSIGTCIAILPLFGLSPILGIGIVMVWKHINKYALFFALAFWNPITLVPIYILGTYIGDLIFGSAPIIEYEVDLIYRIYHLTRRLLVGNAILSIILGSAMYPITKSVVLRYRLKR